MLGSATNIGDGSHPCQLQVLCNLRPSLYSFAYAALGNREDAEDAVQETLLQALGVFRKGGSRAADLSAYVFGIARHVISDVHAHRFRSDGDVRGSRRIRSSGRGNGNGCHGGSNAHEPARALDAAIVNQRKRAIDEALALLTRPQRVVIRACFYQGHSCATVARHQSVPAARVRKTKSRALGRLRSLLDAEL